MANPSSEYLVSLVLILHARNVSFTEFLFHFEIKICLIIFILITMVHFSSFDLVFKFLT